MNVMFQVCRTQMIAIIAGASMLATLALTGCSGGISKRELAGDINDEIKKEKVQFALQEKKAPSWPLRVQRPLGLMSEQKLDHILIAMQAAGYLKITQEREPRGFNVLLVDVITPTEEAKKWWDIQNGFCVGTKTVAEVQEWTEPGAPSQRIQVKYTWRLTDVPSWAKRPEFDTIPGMSTPVAKGPLLYKTSNG